MLHGVRVASSILDTSTDCAATTTQSNGFQKSPLNTQACYIRTRTCGDNSAENMTAFHTWTQILWQASIGLARSQVSLTVSADCTGRAEEASCRTGNKYRESPSARLESSRPQLRRTTHPTQKRTFKAFRRCIRARTRSKMCAVCLCCSRSKTWQSPRTLYWRLGSTSDQADVARRHIFGQGREELSLPHQWWQSPLCEFLASIPYKAVLI